MTPKTVLPGDTYGYWTVLREVDHGMAPDGKTFRVVLVRCVCGHEREVRLATLTRGNSLSCGTGGCFHRVRHGHVPENIGTRKRDRGGPDLRTTTLERRSRLGRQGRA